MREIWNSWGLQSINTHRKRAAIIGISHKGSPFENVGSNKIQKCETPRKKADQIFGKTAKASEKVHQKSPTCLMIFFSFFFLEPKPWTHLWIRLEKGGAFKPQSHGW